MAPHCFFTPQEFANLGEFFVKLAFLLGYFWTQLFVCTFMMEHISNECADLSLIEKYSLVRRLKRRLEALGGGAVAYLILMTFFVTLLFVDWVMEKEVRSCYPFLLLLYCYVQAEWVLEMLSCVLHCTNWCSAQRVQLMKEKHQVQLFLIFLLEMLFLFCISALPAMVFIWLFW